MVPIPFWALALYPLLPRRRTFSILNLMRRSPHPATISFRKIRKFWHDLDELDSRCIFIGVGLYRGLSDSPTFGRVSRTTCAHARREKGVPSSEKKLESIQKNRKTANFPKRNKNSNYAAFFAVFCGSSARILLEIWKNTRLLSPLTTLTSHSSTLSI